MTTQIPRQKLRNNLSTTAISNRNTETDTMQNLNTIPSNNIFRGVAASASALRIGGAAPVVAERFRMREGQAAAANPDRSLPGQCPRRTASRQWRDYPALYGRHRRFAVRVHGADHIGPCKSDMNGNFSISGNLYLHDVGHAGVYRGDRRNPGSGTNADLSHVGGAGLLRHFAGQRGHDLHQHQRNHHRRRSLRSRTVRNRSHPYRRFRLQSDRPGERLCERTTPRQQLHRRCWRGKSSCGATVPATEINTIGNIIAACVNTNGASSSGCTPLFSATGATDTFGAALGIAKNPGASAITAPPSLSSSHAPFQPSLSTSAQRLHRRHQLQRRRHLATPYAIALDAAAMPGSPTKPAPLSPSFRPAALFSHRPRRLDLVGAQGIAVDSNGNVWVANTAGNSVIKFALTAGGVTGTSAFTNGGIDAPTAIALDSAGTAWITNFNGNSVTALANNGLTVSGSPFPGDGQITVPSGIAVGLGSGAIYVTSGNGSVEKLTNAGAFSNVLTDGTLQGPVALALAGAGQLGVTGFTTGASVGGALSEFNSGGSAGTPASVSPVTSGLSSPSGIASDGISFWVANSAAGGSLAQFTFGSATPASPVAGFGSLNTPVGVAVDSSGSVWTANSGDNSVSKFIGIAQPFTTPIALNVGP